MKGFRYSGGGCCDEVKPEQPKTVVFSAGPPTLPPDFCTQLPIAYDAAGDTVWLWNETTASWVIAQSVTPQLVYLRGAGEILLPNMGPGLDVTGATVDGDSSILIANPHPVPIAIMLTAAWHLSSAVYGDDVTAYNGTTFVDGIVINAFGGHRQTNGPAVTPARTYEDEHMDGTHTLLIPASTTIELTARATVAISSPTSTGDSVFTTQRVRYDWYGVGLIL